MYRILVNQCKTYRIERLIVPEDDPTEAAWKLVMEHPGGGAVQPREWPSWDKAMAWIVTENEKPEWVRKENAWTIIEEVKEPCDE